MAFVEVLHLGDKAVLQQVMVFFATFLLPRTIIEQHVEAIGLVVISGLFLGVLVGGTPEEVVFLGVRLFRALLTFTTTTAACTSTTAFQAFVSLQKKQYVLLRHSGYTSNSGYYYSSLCSLHTRNCHPSCPVPLFDVRWGVDCSHDGAEHGAHLSMLRR